MLSFNRTTDPCSLDVFREGRFVGNLLWHAAAPPQFRPMCAMADCYLTLEEMRQMLSTFEATTAKDLPMADREPAAVRAERQKKK